MGQYDLFRKIAQSNLSAKERDVNLIKNDILSDFEDSPSFNTVLIDGSSKGVHIIDENAISKNPNKKRLLCKPNESISMGNLVYWKNNYWICTNIDNDDTVQIKGIIEKCNNMLKWYDENGKLIRLPCIFNDSISSTDFNYNSNIITLDGNIKITIQYNSDSCKIKENRRFLFNGQAYKVTNVFNHSMSDINNSNSVTLIRLDMVKDNLAPDDDSINNIPNTQTYNYTISIDQGTSLEQQVNYSSTLSYTIKKNGVVVTDIPVIWTSSNTSVCEIEQNGNFIDFSLLSVGTATITCSMKDNSSISATYSITVVESPSGVVDIIIDPATTSLLQGDTVNYVVKKTIDGNDSGEVLTIQDITTGIPIGYYTFSSGVNAFTIINIKMFNGVNVKILISDNYGNSKEIDVQLKAW